MAINKEKLKIKLEELLKEMEDQLAEEKSSSGKKAVSGIPVQERSDFADQLLELMERELRERFGMVQI